MCSFVLRYKEENLQLSAKILPANGIPLLPFHENRFLRHGFFSGQRRELELLAEMAKKDNAANFRKRNICELLVPV